MDKKFAEFKNITNEFNLSIKDLKSIKGEPLFARLDINKEIDYLLKGDEKVEENKEEKKEVEKIKGKAEITFEDFEKLELKVGRILSAEKVENADKLLKLSVKIGDDVRTIVSGVATFYSPEYLINKEVVVLTNLKPRKIRGIESKGMILYAYTEDDTKLLFITPEKEIEDGVEVG